MATTTLLLPLLLVLVLQVDISLGQNYGYLPTNGPWRTNTLPSSTYPLPQSTSDYVNGPNIAYHPPYSLQQPSRTTWSMIPEGTPIQQHGIVGDVNVDTNTNWNTNVRDPRFLAGIMKNLGNIIDSHGNLRQQLS